MWKDFVRERSVAKYLLARVLGLYIPGASKLWCGEICHCYELLQLLSALLGWFYEAKMCPVYCYGQFDQLLWTCRIAV